MLLIEDKTLELELQEEREVSRGLRRIKDDLAKLIEPVEETTKFVAIVIQKLKQLPDFSQLRMDIIKSTREMLKRIQVWKDKFDVTDESSTRSEFVAAFGVK